MNTTKIMATFMFAMIVMSVISPMVLAQEEVETVVDTSVEEGVIAVDTSEDSESDIEEESDEEAGINPDSILYGLDRAMERISLALTFDKEKKAEKALRHAEERLAEVKAMIEANKDKQAEKAQKHYEESLERAEKAAEEIKSNGNADSAQEALEKTERIQKKIGAHRAKVSAVHSSILERLKAGDKLTEEQIAHLEDVFSRLDKRAKEAESKVLTRRENLRTRYKVLSEAEDDDDEDEDLEVEADDDDDDSEVDDDDSDSSDSSD